ncbi:MAG: DUF4181 domain-containing protein [Solibacillus sp.]
MYKGVNRFQRWIEGSLSIIFLISVCFFTDYMFLLLISYYVIMNLFRTLMEWKYEREKKQYILTLHSIILYLLILGSSLIFLF